MSFISYPILKKLSLKIYNIKCFWFLWGMPSFMKIGLKLCLWEVIEWGMGQTDTSGKTLGSSGLLTDLKIITIWLLDTIYSNILQGVMLYSIHKNLTTCSLSIWERTHWFQECGGSVIQSYVRTMNTDTTSVFIGSFVLWEGFDWKKQGGEFRGLSHVYYHNS